jgi:hypothetical protein
MLGGVQYGNVRPGAAAQFVDDRSHLDDLGPRADDAQNSLSRDAVRSLHAQT